jgi:hypothetical protein
MMGGDAVFEGYSEPNAAIKWFYQRPCSHLPNKFPRMLLIEAKHQEKWLQEKQL